MDLNTVLKEVVKGSIAPLLKSVAFKKSGNNFYREVGDIIQCLNIQQNKWNTADSKSFTLNLGLTHKNIHKELSDKILPKFPKEYNCVIRTRLTNLNSHKKEWYPLHEDTNIYKLVNEINNDLLDYAIPFFKKYENTTNWLDFTSPPFNAIASDSTMFLILMELQRFDDATILIKNLFIESLTPRTAKSTIHYPDGIIITEESEPFINWDHVNHIKELANKYKIEL